MTVPTHPQAPFEDTCSTATSGRLAATFPHSGGLRAGRLAAGAGRSSSGKGCAKRVKLVRDLMHIGVTTCLADTPLVEATRILLREDLESLIVLDDHSHAVGVFGRREIVEVYAQSGAKEYDLETLTVADVMRPDIPQVPPDIPAIAAVQIMLDQEMREIYLMHHSGGTGWPAAVLRFEDVLRYLIAESEADVADMGAGAPRKSPIETFTRR